MSSRKKTKVNRLLKVAGVKQKDIAAQVGVTPQFVNSVVNGRRATPRVVQAIAAALGRSVSELWPEME